MAKEGSDLALLVQTWRRFSGILLAMQLEKEKELTNKVLPLTLSAYTLSRDIPI